MGHLCEVVYEPDMLDAAKCSCGWHSKWYYDGVEYAVGEWKRHMEKATSMNAYSAGVAVETGNKS